MLVINYWLEVEEIFKLAAHQATVFVYIKYRKIIICVIDFVKKCLSNANSIFYRNRVVEGEEGEAMCTRCFLEKYQQIEMSHKFIRVERGSAF